MYHFDFTPGAEDDLDRLDPQVRTRVLKRLKWLADNAERVRHESLSGPLGDLFKFRIGDYRVLYDLIHGEHLLLIHEVKHRSEVYRAK